MTDHTPPTPESANPDTANPDTAGTTPSAVPEADAHSPAHNTQKPTGASRAMWLVRGAVSSALLAGLILLLRPDATAGDAGSRAVFSLGFLVLAGSIGGQLASMVGLPRLTGYLAMGVLAGPSGLGLLGTGEVQSLQLVNGLALALIALQAGAELTVPMLKKSARTLWWASVGHATIIPLGMTALFFALSPWMSFTEGLGWPAILAVGGVWSAMAVSRAPADALAIMGEARSKGPLSTYTLGMVVVLDVVVLILFAFAIMLASVALTPGAHFSMHEIVHLMQEIGASVAAGTTFGLIIAFWFWAVGREKLLFVIVVGYGITAFCRYFHYDTLLVFVVAGFVVQNLTKEGHDLVHTVESVASGVMVVFFATAGASLDLNALAQTWPIALALAGGRGVLTYAANRFGHRMADDEAVLKKTSFSGLISQAGVTIGLATIAAEKLGPVGAGISSLVIAVIGINELVGPVLFKWGLNSAGEVGKADGPPAH